MADCQCEGDASHSFDAVTGHRQYMTSEDDERTADFPDAGMCQRICLSSDGLATAVAAPFS